MINKNSFLLLITLVTVPVLADYVDLTGSYFPADDSNDDGAVISTAIGGVTFERTLYLPAGVYNIETSTIVGSNISLLMEEGAIFKVASGRTLTINGVILAGLTQIFDETGGGAIVGAPQVDALLPQWFGAVADDPYDDGPALQRSLDAMEIFQQNLYLPDGEYLIDAMVDVLLYSGGEIRGGGATVLRKIGSHQEATLKIHYVRDDLHIQGITVDADQKSNVGLWIRNNSIDHEPSVTLKDCSFRNALESATVGIEKGAGARVYGKFLRLDVIGCEFTGIGSEKGPGNAQASGLSVAEFFSGGNHYYTKHVRITCSLFSNITNPHTVSQGVDADGIALITSQEPETSLYLDNSQFVNCQGRSVKTRARNNTILNNTFTRSDFPGYLEIDLQESGGVITKNRFYCYGAGNVPTDIIGNTVRQTPSRMSVFYNTFHFLNGAIGQNVVATSMIPLATYPLESIDIVSNTVYGTTDVFGMFRMVPIAGDTHYVSLRNNTIDGIGGSFIATDLADNISGVAELRGLFKNNQVLDMVVPGINLDINTTFNPVEWFNNINIQYP